MTPPSPLGPEAALEHRRLRAVRVWLSVFAAGLVLSGATAIPLAPEVAFLARRVDSTSGLGVWLHRVAAALAAIQAQYPFMAYGTDWLAFGHFVIAVAFIGPLRDPVRNVWVVDFGLIACVLVIPYALGMGALRGIPLGWRLLDCSFGVLGLCPLLYCRRCIATVARWRRPGLTPL